MTLQEISASDRLVSAFLSELREEAPLLPYIEFYSMVGNADAPRKASSAEGGGYRQLNQDYGPNEVDPAFGNPQLAILGDKVETDVAHERRGADIPSVRAQDLRAFARYFGKFFHDQIVNGAGQGGSPIKLNGIKGLLPMNNDQAIYAEDNSNAHEVSYGNSNSATKSQQQLKVKLNRLIAKVDGGPDVLLLSDALLQFITSIFEAQVETTRTEFGTLLTTYNRIPMVPAGYAPGGGAVIAQDENPGSITSDTQSIYALKFGEKMDLSYATNVGLQVMDKGVVDVHYTYHVDLDMQAALLNDQAVARLAGVAIA
jgi:hypothetical protein